MASPGSQSTCPAFRVTSRRWGRIRSQSSPIAARMALSLGSTDPPPSPVMGMRERRYGSRAGVHAVVPGAGVKRLCYMTRRTLDPSLGCISLAVGVLGMLGLTAYAGMVLLAQPRSGETAVVSAASGGVGQIAGQLARIHGARVVGIAGREKKCRYVVDELKFDACVSHLSPTFADDLRAACPDGVDVYFENVGGAVFDAVLPLFNAGARMTICGLIAHYGDDAGADARAALMRRGEAIFKRRGVTVGDLFVGNFVESHHDIFLREVAPLVASGEVKYLEDIRQGIEALPACFAEMLHGSNFGKMLVQVGEDPTL